VNPCHHPVLAAAVSVPTPSRTPRRPADNVGNAPSAANASSAHPTPVQSTAPFGIDVNALPRSRFGSIASAHDYAVVAVAPPQHGGRRRHSAALPGPDSFSPAAADRLGLGFMGSIVLFAVIIVVPALGYWRFRLNTVVAFWFAYVVTRPLGASIADWLSKPTQHGGVNLGDRPVAAALLLAIVVTVAALNGRWAPTARARRQQTSSSPTTPQPQTPRRWLQSSSQPPLQGKSTA
jgi:Repeat of Unknown Function (DUF347)